MKKLSVIFLSIFVLLLVSCAQSADETPNQKDNRKEWDADNIAYTNTANNQKLDYTRKDGENGIIGKFNYSKTVEVPNAIGFDSSIYTFNSNGEYQNTEYKTRNDSSVDKYEYSGTFTIKKYNEEYFILTLKKSKWTENSYFYKVSKDGFDWYRYITVNGEQIEPPTN